MALISKVRGASWGRRFLWLGLVLVGLQGIPLLVGGREDSGGTEVVQAEGIEQQIGATVTALASNLILGDGDDDEEEEGGGFLGLGNSRSSSSPAPTTSQS